jgi:hypothetical protein
MSPPPHVIRRQLVELHLPAGTDSRAVQERVSRLCREALTALLDEHLSQHAGSANVQLARLELDLGTIALADLEQVLPQRLAHELARVLPPAVLAAAGPAAGQRQASAGSSLAGAAGPHLAHGAPAAGSPPGKPAGKDTDLIAYFLRTGLLPWWATPVSARRLADAFTRARLHDAGALKQLVTELLDEPVATARLVYSCPDALLEQLLGLWLPVASQHAQQLQASMLGPAGTTSTAAGRLAWWYGLYKTVATAGVAAGQYDVAAIYQLLISFMAAKEGGSCTAPLAAQGTLELLTRVFSLQRAAVPAPARPTTPMLPEPLAPQKPTALSNEGARENTVQSQLPRPLPVAGSAPPPAEPLRPPTPVAVGEDGLRPATAETPRQTPAPLLAPQQPGLLSASSSIPLGQVGSFSDSDKIGIQNAGLILLWPFLPRFFATLGLTSEGQFAHEASATRACLLLQYLVAGTSDEVFEASLPLNKLLCGIDLAQPLPTAWDIQPAEASAATTLLEAVIQNGPLWRTLSVEGFRQAFLQREGLLSTRDGHWLLQAARETHDIIIDRLPWAVRHVKLPWMEHLLFTEWQQA